MIIRKLALPRRTFLRGLGATVALPFLDAMVPAMVTKGLAANRPSRIGFVYAPNGQTMTDAKNYWTPKGVGKDFEFSPILSPLEPYRDQLTIVSGLAQVQAEALGDGNGEHTRAGATWLNGVHPKKTEGAGIAAGVSADQLAAAQFGKSTVLPSLEMMVSEIDLVLGGQCEAGYSCAYLNTISWQAANTPLPVENNPSVIFDRLFGEGGSREERLQRLQANKSMLDHVTGDLGRLQRTLGPGDRMRVDQYLESVREIERRIGSAERQSGDPAMALPARPDGVPTQFSEHVKLMFDLQVLAYQADLTRVFTLMLGRELNQRNYPEIGIAEPHHGLSHHGNKPEMMEKYAKLNRFEASLFAYFLERLKSTPEGDGNLLDNSILLYGSGFSNGDVHWHRDLPLVVAGGGSGNLKGGRHLMYPPAEMVPMTNLLVSLLDKAGVEMHGGIGDSTGKLNLETLSGM